MIKIDSSKRDLTERIILLYNTEGTIKLIVDRYCARSNKPRNEVIQSHINDIVLESWSELIKAKNETEIILKSVINSNDCEVDILLQ